MTKTIEKIQDSLQEETAGREEAKAKVKAVQAKIERLETSPPRKMEGPENKEAEIERMRSEMAEVTDELTVRDNTIKKLQEKLQGEKDRRRKAEANSQAAHKEKLELRIAFIETQHRREIERLRETEEKAFYKFLEAARPQPQPQTNYHYDIGHIGHLNHTPVHGTSGDVVVNNGPDCGNNRENNNVDNTDNKGTINSNTAGRDGNMNEPQAEGSPISNDSPHNSGQATGSIKQNAGRDRKS